MPVRQSLFTFATALRPFFLTRTVNQKLLDSMLGFAAGVMLAASYWSLLAPAIEISEHGTLPAWLIPALGFVSGGGMIWVLDRIIPHLHPEKPVEQAEGPQRLGIAPYCW